MQSRTHRAANNPYSSLKAVVRPQPMLKKLLCVAGRMAAHPHKRRRSRYSAPVAVLTSTASARNNNNDDNNISLTLQAPGTCDAAASSSAPSSNTATESKQSSSSLDQPTPFTTTTTTTTKPPQLSNVNAASQAIPRPESAKASQHSKSIGTSGGGNYVKLNVRNKAGSCRGARNTKAKNKANQLSPQIRRRRGTMMNRAAAKNKRAKQPQQHPPFPFATIINKPASS